MYNERFKSPALDDMRLAKKTARNVNIVYREKLNSLERLALWATEKVGSAGFFLLIVIWTIIWLLWNTFGPINARFDPYPAFVLWLFISNMIQLFLLPLLLVGQNLQGRHAETRAEIDFEVNLKSEKNLETALAHLERQKEMLTNILLYLEQKLEQNKKSELKSSENKKSSSR